MQQQDLVRESREIFVRCVTVLYAAFVSGAHVSLEQPPNAMSWLELEASFFLSAIEADCNVVPACAFDWDIAKRCMFASSLRAPQALASSCPHGMRTHASIAGIRDEFGGFVSQQSAEYPTALSDFYARQAQHLFTPDADASLLSLQDTFHNLPGKPIEASFPCACQDGGGIYSLPDWSTPQSGVRDDFSYLRGALQHFLCKVSAPARLINHVQNHRDTPLFSSEEVDHFRGIFRL